MLIQSLPMKSRRSMACDTFDILPHIPSLFMVSHEGETHKSQVNESQASKSQTRELIMSANQKSKHVCNTSAFCFFYLVFLLFGVSSGVCLNPTPSADFWLPVFQHAAQLPQSTSPQTLAGLVWSLQSTSLLTAVTSWPSVESPVHLTTDCSH